MNSFEITHFSDVIKKEPTIKNESDVFPVAFDLNNVEQYHCKEELDVTWDERDNDYGASQENYDFSNNLSYKLNYPIVVIERLPNDIFDKYSSSVKRESRFDNSVTLNCKRRDFLQYYQKICTKCKQRQTSAKSTRKCKNCKIRLKYECNKCSKQLLTWEGIVYHLNTKCIQKGHYYACFKCNYKSPFRSQVKQHLKKVHSILCSLNRIQEFKRENVENDVVDSAKLYKCSKCEQQFNKLPPFLRHTQTCGQAKNNAKSFGAARNAYQDQCLHHCLQCNQTVKNIGGGGKFNKKKCQNCHSKFSFICKKCNNIFQSYTTIYLHLKIKHKNVKDVFTCPECNYKSISLDNLASHVRRLHVIDSQECRQCGKKYRNIVLLREHLRSCINELKFQCDVCSYRSKSKAILKRHIVDVHTTGNEIDCPRCGISLKNNSCFQGHTRYCKKEPNHQCNSCSFKTKYKNRLKTHCQTMHDKSHKKTK